MTAAQNASPRAGGPAPVDGLRVALAAGVATLTLNRPERRNAVTHAMWLGIAAHCRWLAANPDVRVLVVRGEGGHFCAGADVAGLAQIPAADHLAANRDAEAALAAFPKPAIAHIEGACVGGGVEIAVACDLRIAAAGARFGITPARLGLVYPSFAVERVVALIGPSATKHLLFSAEVVDAERALRIGLVDEVHEPAAAAERVASLSEVMASSRSSLTQQASKEMVDAVVATGSVPGPVARRWADEVAASSDPAEGIAAFLERRPPRFGWRSPGDGERG